MNWRRFKPFTHEELSVALADLPPIIDANQAARLSCMSKSTLYKRVARGFYRDSVCRDGGLKFFTRRFVAEHFRRERRP
jgi:hypothetical protein